MAADRIDGVGMWRHLRRGIMPRKYLNLKMNEGFENDNCRVLISMVMYGNIRLVGLYSMFGRP